MPTFLEVIKFKKKYVPTYKYLIVKMYKYAKIDQNIPCCFRVMTANGRMDRWMD